jgi:hypothetical protein
MSKQRKEEGDVLMPAREEPSEGTVGIKVSEINSLSSGTGVVGRLRGVVTSTKMRTMIR